MAGFKISAKADASFAKDLTFWAKQVQFANLVALSRVAVINREALYDEFRLKIENPTPFTMSSLQAKPATKTTPYAETRTRDVSNSVPAGRYLDPQVYGGQRTMKSMERKLGSYIVPSKYLDLNSYGNVEGGTVKKVLTQLRTEDVNSASSSKKSKRKRKQSAYFYRNGIIFKRMNVATVPREGQKNTGSTIVPQFIFIENKPDYTPKIDWDGVSERVFNENYSREFDKAFAQAMSTSGFKGKW